MTEIAERVLRRYLEAAMSEEKLNELLLKIRKGATSSLNWTQLGAVLAALDPGWKLEKMVGLAKLYGYGDKMDEPEFFWGRSQGEAEARWRTLEPQVVTSLPSSPKVGQLYVMDLEPVTEGRPGDWSFKFKVWMGAEGWRITTPDGKTRDELPGRYDLGDFQHGYRTKTRSKLHVWDAVKWLNTQTDWLAQINRKLGMDAHEPAAPRTREGTGSCPVCFQNIKARPEIVLHGYKRPGTGQVHGNCSGMGYLPFEVSVKGTKAYLDEVLERQLKDAKEYLKKLKAGDIKVLPARYGQKMVTLGDPQWDRTLKATLEDLEDSQIPRMEGLIGAYKRLVQHWKERPLPKEGERHIDWFEKGQKP